MHFRPVPHLPRGFDGDAPPNVLRFSLEPEGLVAELTGVGPHGQTLAPLTLTAGQEPAALPAYGRLLLDVLHRNAALSIRGDEAEESWRIVSPVLEAWGAERVPLEEYPAGSAGPSARAAGSPS